MRSILLSCGAVLIGACAADPAPEPVAAPVAAQPLPVPARPAVHRTWNSNAEGYTFSVGYFTPEQEASQEWENTRLLLRKMASVCEEKRLVRREVRWFDPAVPGGPRCARVVYSFTCKFPGPAAGTLEFAGRQALLDEPAEPIPANCGEKDQLKLPPRAAPRYSREGELISRPLCRELGDKTEGRLRLNDVTYLKARQLFSSGYAAKGDYAFPKAEGQFLSYLGAVESKRHIVVITRDLTPDDQTILLDQIVTDNNDGYCVTLIARQGENLWQRTIKRMSAPEPSRTLSDGVGHSRTPSAYWDPYIDAHTLTHELAEYLGLKLPRDHQQSPDVQQ